MTQDEIIKLAKRSGVLDSFIGEPVALERFYDLAIKPWAKQLKAERKRFEEYRDMTVGVMRDVRMDERKECAKIADTWKDNVVWEARTAADNIGREIRARGDR